MFFFLKWKIDLAIGPACFQLHCCHHQYGPQVWQLVFFFPLFLFPCERKRPPTVLATVVAHIKKVPLGSVQNGFRWILVLIDVCVLPIGCTTLCFCLSVKWQCIFTQDYLNFRWEEENQNDRQRGESCLERGESSTQTHTQTVQILPWFAPR